MKPISRRGFLRAAGAGAATAVAAGAYGRESIHWLDCNEYSFELPRWTRDGFKVGFISDCHLTEENAVQVTVEAVDYVLEQKPDVLIFGGDFVEDTRDGSLERMKRAFLRIRDSGIPAVTVFGNHDYAANNYLHVISTAKDLGFHTLRNQAFRVGDVTIFGLDSMSFGLENLDRLLEVQERENVLVVLHEPDGSDLLPDFPSLMLAGHSHGGQICLPTGVPITTPGGARKYKKGFYPDLRVPTFVSRGLGETGVRLRLFCRPEASILHLSGKADA